MGIVVRNYDSHTNTSKMMVSTTRSNIIVKLFVVYSMLLLIACTDNNDYYKADIMKEFHVGTCEDTIRGELFASSDINISGIELHDSILIIMGSSSAPNLFYMYDVNSKDLMFSFGRIGHSNDEFINAPIYCYFDSDGNRSRMLVPDEMTTKVIDFDETIRQKKGVFGKSRNHRYDGDIFFFLNGDTTIARKALSYIDPRDKIFFPPKVTRYVGNQSKEVIIYPQIIKSDNIGLLHFLYGSELRIKPDKSMVVEALCLIDIINIIDVNTGRVVGIKESGTYSFEDVEKIQSVTDLEDKMIAYNHAMYITDNYIYLLQDRCSITELNGKEVADFPVLLVLDWDGELIGEVYLDKGIYSFTCDEKNALLYGYDVEGCIYQYNISKYIRNK